MKETLEKQFEKWLEENPDSELTYYEWIKKYNKNKEVDPTMSNNFQVGVNTNNDDND